MAVGTKASLNPKKHPSYPKFVTFSNPEDPRSITVAQEWERQGDGGYVLKDDHMEELFGQGGKIKGITFEITDDKRVIGGGDGYLPSVRPISGLQRFIGMR